MNTQFMRGKKNPSDFELKDTSIRNEDRGGYRRDFLRL